MQTCRDASFQAAETSSDERRRRLAALLKNSIKRDELEHEEERKLLTLLGQINDAELIILGYYGTDMVGKKADEYYMLHKATIDSPPRQTCMPEEAIREATMKQNYRDTLRRLGLIASRNTGSDRITPLGRLLLSYVDGPKSEWIDT